MKTEQSPGFPDSKASPAQGTSESTIIDGKRFLESVKPLMVGLFCLPGEKRAGTAVALISSIEERLETFQSLNRVEFLQLFRWALDHEEREDAT
jgi:hypothetical protein